MREASPDTRERLLTAAKALAADRGWPWLAPVDIRLSSSGSGERAWTIRTNAHEVGMNIRILIRESDGAIVQAGYLPR